MSSEYHRGGGHSQGTYDVVGHTIRYQLMTFHIRVPIDLGIHELPRKIPTEIGT
jgi:hypothetical protein